MRATAGKTLRLRAGAQLGSAFAHTVITGDDLSESKNQTSGDPAPKLEFPGSRTAETGAGKSAGDGLERQRLRMLSADCWAYAGDFKPAVPLRITTKLIVKGDCVLLPDSVLEADLKADGRIEVGSRTVCRGNVIAGGGIRFAPESRFCGVVHAGKTLRLCAGVCGGSESSKVAVYAAETLSIECGVVVHGKLASGDCVVVTEQASTR